MCCPPLGSTTTAYWRAGHRIPRAYATRLPGCHFLLPCLLSPPLLLPSPLVFHPLLFIPSPLFLPPPLLLFPLLLLRPPLFLHHPLLLPPFRLLPPPLLIHPLLLLPSPLLLHPLLLLPPPLSLCMLGFLPPGTPSSPFRTGHRIARARDTSKLQSGNLPLFLLCLVYHLRAPYPMSVPDIAEHPCATQPTRSTTRYIRPDIA
eukprot:704181-Rhodomonas_salina.1